MMTVLLLLRFLLILSSLLVLFLSFLRNHQRLPGEYSVHAREEVEEINDEQKTSSAADRPRNTDEFIAMERLINAVVKTPTEIQVSDESTEVEKEEDAHTQGEYDTPPE
jgi:cytoskeletal protein RodZ